ncbi:ABC transporter substrate-binding protein [Glaciimonas sp. PCH181]|uniref:ABC transporter substrate-binding protein n=1 Tax=Glaciimonas sp. PCH181 TaxID=2133943 RepID=UPI000D373466|nr:ABC transporter substrate-binding protein [Glaciimonas sp. PCH181]PUA16351.1 aliphatic sulfonates ABC transporter substrate-binding protein [Glaciimonas sp. PCH181]
MRSKLVGKIFASTSDKTAQKSHTITQHDSHKKSHLRRLVVGSLLSIGFSLAAPSLVSAADAPARILLKVADQKGGIRAQLESAGELKNLPYDIKWSEFPAAAPLLEALNAGAVDIGFAGDAPLIFALAAGAPLKAIGVNKTDPYGTAIIANADSPLSGAASLKGKRIATGRGSIGHYLVLASLASVGLKTSDVSFKFLSPVDAKAALSGNSVDAWATWEPYTALAEKTEHAKIVVNGRGLSAGLSYLIAHESAIKDKRAALQDFLQRLARAQRWSNEHVDAFAATLSELIGVPKEVAKLSWERRQGKWVPIDDIVIKTQQHTADVYTEAGIIPRKIDVSVSFDRSFPLQK